MSGKPTPGPWGWFGDQHGVYLATQHSGRRYVMGFRRFGMNGAQPTFQIDRMGMVPASELVEFDVGDRAVRGVKAALAAVSVYRYDVTAIDHPDARLIAAAPDILDALKEADRYLVHHVPEDCPPVTTVRAAIAKAEGRS